METLKVKIKTPWESQKVNLYSDTEESVGMDAKRAVAEFTAAGTTHTTPVAVFINPKTKHVWGGREANFYFETDSGIMGGWLGGNILQWYKSLIPKIEQGEQLDDIVNRFDAKFDYSKIMQDSEPSTDLRPALSPFFFNRFENSSAPAVAKIKKVEIKDRIVKLDLESPWGSKASVWISVDTRKILKAVENGGQTFPKRDVKKSDNNL